MKKFLYFGAALMIVACVYGFVDYKNTSQNKEFINMYKKETPTPVIQKGKPYETELTKEKINTNKEMEDKKTTVPNNTHAHVKKIDLRTFSRAPLRNFDTIRVKK
jgi:hypothetical protein